MNRGGDSLRRLRVCLAVVVVVATCGVLSTTTTATASQAATPPARFRGYDAPLNNAPTRSIIEGASAHGALNSAARQSSLVGRPPSSFASVVAANSESGLVNLASEARTTHILDGEVRPNGTFGGGHRAGTGFPLKSEFPASWSDEEIMHNVSDVATDPNSVFRRGHGGDIFATGTRVGNRYRGASPQLGDLDRLPDERSEEPAAVSESDAYVGRVRGLLISIADRLSRHECGEVGHLIEHGEPAEGMRSLAWIIVERRLKVPAATVAELRDLTAGLIEDEHMPPDLDDFIEV